MKQHKDRGVWAHKPDALPLEDAPSMGAKRKKGPLGGLSKKHLWDKLKQEKKELERSVESLSGRGFSDLKGFELDMTEWALSSIVSKAEAMDGLINELEGRMG